MRLEGKVCAVTGAGRGIGRAAAERFAREGASVALLEVDSRTGRDAESVIKGAGGQAVFIETDVSDAVQVKAAFDEIEQTFGALHVLYNNASVFRGGRDAAVTDLDERTWEEILAVNLNSVYYCCKCGIPLIAGSGGGSIINTSSSAGILGIPKCDAYTATKGATITLTRSMAVEYGPEGIRVNCIAPAAILTEMVQQSNFSDPEFDEQAFLDTTPLRRWGTAEDIANIALFLASDESSYVNGAVIVADGGLTIT